MNTSKLKLITILSIFPLPFCAFGEVRTFTSNDGKTIQAELVERSQDGVTIKREDGVIFTVQPDRFSEEDRKYIETFPIIISLTKEQLKEIFMRLPEIKNRDPLPIDYQPLIQVRKDFIREFEFLNPETYKVNLKSTLKKIESSRKFYTPIANSDFTVPTKGLVGGLSKGSPSWKEGLSAQIILAWLAELEKFIGSEYKVENE